jgi:hypothetical protein
MKATSNQIQFIDEALKKIGIGYIDIRYEMIDHIAAELEEKEGNFENNLLEYIISHKKKLRKTNRKFMFISMGNAYKTLFCNMLSIKFLALFVIIFINAFLLNLLIERESVIRIMFIVFTIVVSISSLPGVYNILKKRDIHSFSHGLSFINLITLYPGIFMMRWQREIVSDNLVLLYYTAVISISIIMSITLRQLDTQYKVRYND